MTDAPTDEIALLRRMAARDEKALGEFYDRFSKQLYTLAVRVLKSEREAEEVVQDVFLSAWRQAADFDGQRASVFTWLVGMTRNKCIDRLRKAERRLPPAKGEQEEGMEVTVMDTRAHDPSHSAALAESSNMVREIVRELPEAQRRVLELAFFDGLTHSEIAEHLSEAVGTVKSRIRLAMDKLRARLQGEAL